MYLRRVGYGINLTTIAIIKKSPPSPQFLMTLWYPTARNLLRLHVWYSTDLSWFIKGVHMHIPYRPSATHYHSMDPHGGLRADSGVKSNVEVPFRRPSTMTLAYTHLIASLHHPSRARIGVSTWPMRKRSQAWAAPAGLLFSISQASWDTSTTSLLCSVLSFS